MSLWADYKRELEGKDVFEWDDAFVVYSINGDECYVRDIYVAPESRGKGRSQAIGRTVENIAKDAGCKKLIGTVDLNKSGAKISLLMQFKFGYELKMAHDNVIVLEKRLNE